MSQVFSLGKLDFGRRGHHEDGQHDHMTPEYFLVWLNDRRIDMLIVCTMCARQFTDGSAHINESPNSWNELQVSFSFDPVLPSQTFRSILTDFAEVHEVVGFICYLMSCIYKLHSFVFTFSLFTSILCL